MGERVPHGVGTRPECVAISTARRAALTLYRLSAMMFDELIPDKHRDVVNNTLKLIKEAGYA